VTERLKLDHLVYGVPDLAEAIDDFEKRLGLTPVLGGRHEGLGTHNAILPLGGETYLELIASDPDGPIPNQPRPFGLDTLRDPRLVTWAVRSRSIESDVELSRKHGFDPGIVLAMTRRESDGQILRWQLSLRQKPFGDGLVPFVIDWGKSRHPAAVTGLGFHDQNDEETDPRATARPAPAAELSDFSATHPDPASIQTAFDALGVVLDVQPGTTARLNARLTGPAGFLELDPAN
jgi:hypothetical protein